jgi:uncharacterized protein
MDQFHLAVLAQWVGDKGLNGRKRLQKVVYFLQRAGCPLNAEFTLHHYGPYSRDVADVCDQMVASHLMEEHTSPNATGVQYRYLLPPPTVQLLEKSEALHPERARVLAPFRELALELFAGNLWELELGSTILYFQEQTNDWPKAILKACAFKQVAEGDSAIQSSAKLAKRIAEYQPKIAT